MTRMVIRVIRGSDFGCGLTLVYWPHEKDRDSLLPGLSLVPSSGRPCGGVTPKGTRRGSGNNGWEGGRVQCVGRGQARIRKEVAAISK